MTDFGPLPVTSNRDMGVQGAPQVKARKSDLAVHHIEPENTAYRASQKSKPVTPASLGKWADFESTRSSQKSSDSNEKGGLGAMQGCPQCREMGRDLLGFGATPARLMVVGDSLCAHKGVENNSVLMRSVQMLDRMLENVLGMRRDEVFLSNVVPCRAANMPFPNREELHLLRPFVRQQIALVRPHLLLLMGSAALQAVVGLDEQLESNRGQWRTVSISDLTVRTMTTLHPAYLLQKPENKRLVFGDLKELRKVLDGANE